jgi:hypothetical protein
MSKRSSYYWVAIKWFVFVTEIVIWIGGGIVDFHFVMENDHHFPINPLYLLPFGIHIIITYGSLKTFPLKFSSLGTYKRSSFPKEPSYYEYGYYENSVNYPLEKWYFYPSGIGIKYLFFGRVFIPWKSIITVESSWRRACKIIHTCPEIRSPIICPIRLKEIILRGHKQFTTTGEEKGEEKLP